jgi:hypothetical protein
MNKSNDFNIISSAMKISTITWLIVMMKEAAALMVILKQINVTTMDKGE